MSEDTTTAPAKGPDRLGQGIGIIAGVLVGYYVASRAVAENDNSWLGAGFIGVLLGVAVGVVTWKFVGALRSFLSGDFMDSLEKANRVHRDAQNAQVEAAKARRAQAMAASAKPAAPVGARPRGIEEPRDGAGDDLKLIKGVGPKLEAMLHTMGYWHYDQIAVWTAAEIAWVDANLEGFKGRVTRDDWVAQARALAEGARPAVDDAGMSEEPTTP